MKNQKFIVKKRRKKINEIYGKESNNPYKT